MEKHSFCWWSGDWYTHRDVGCWGRDPKKKILYYDLAGTEKWRLNDSAGTEN